GLSIWHWGAKPLDGPSLRDSRSRGGVSHAPAQPRPLLPRVNGSPSPGTARAPDRGAYAGRPVAALRYARSLDGASRLSQYGPCRREAGPGTRLRATPSDTATVGTRPRASRFATW